MGWGGGRGDISLNNTTFPLSYPLTTAGAEERGKRRGGGERGDTIRGPFNTLTLDKFPSF